MVTLSPVDLETRPWLPNSGWPLEWSELERYYRRAHDYMGLGRYGYDPLSWEDQSFHRLPLENEGITTAIERFPRATRFTTEAFAEVRDSANVTAYLHGPVGSLDGDADRVTHGEVDSGARGRLIVEAQMFVLAGGGLENPRMLLSSRCGAGYGNQHDVVGRYFMDHLRTISGSIIPADPRLFLRAGLYDIVQRDGEVVMGKLTPTDEYLRHNEILNSGAMLLPRPPAHVQEALSAARGLVPALHSRRLIDVRRALTAALRASSYAIPTGARMAVRQRRFPPSTDAGWSNLGGNRLRFATFAVEHQIEQAPRRENRVRLGGRPDAAGRPGLEIEWRWGELDVRSLRRTQQLFEIAFARSNLGRFEPVQWDDVPSLTTPGGSFHPTGTTRMHQDPARGVVAPDGRVHEVSNLFVTGSSVFPTCGYANPTFTVIALAIRLADRIRAELTSRVVA